MSINTTSRQGFPTVNTPPTREPYTGRIYPDGEFTTVTNRNAVYRREKRRLRKQRDRLLYALGAGQRP